MSRRNYFAVAHVVRDMGGKPTSREVRHVPDFPAWFKLDDAARANNQGEWILLGFASDYKEHKPCRWPRCKQDGSHPSARGGFYCEKHHDIVRKGENTP